MLAGWSALKAGIGAGGVKANDAGPFAGGAATCAATGAGALPCAAAAVNMDMENALGVAGCAAGRGAAAADAAFVSE